MLMGFGVTVHLLSSVGQGSTMPPEEPCSVPSNLDPESQHPTGRQLRSLGRGCRSSIRVSTSTAVCACDRGIIILFVLLKVEDHSIRL